MRHPRQRARWSTCAWRLVMLLVALSMCIMWSYLSWSSCSRQHRASCSRVSNLKLFSSSGSSPLFCSRLVSLTLFLTYAMLDSCTDWSSKVLIIFVSVLLRGRFSCGLASRAHMPRCRSGAIQRRGMHGERLRYYSGQNKKSNLLEFGIGPRPCA